MIKKRLIRFESLEERNLLAVAACTASAAPLPQSMSATTWIVTTLADTVNENDNLISLREAVEAASDGDMITFSSSLTGGTIRLTSGHLKVTSAVTITGSNLVDSSGKNGITISGNNSSRVFYTASPLGTISIDYVNITAGNAGSGGQGSGIYNTGGLALDHCNFTGCSATGHSYGGGIRNMGGTVSLTNCTFSGNSTYLGAGLSNKTGTVTIDKCTFSNNSTTANGAAVYNEGTLIITNTQIRNNKAVSGGGVRNFGTMTIVNCCVSNNTASNLGGGIWSSGTTITRNCTIAGNSGGQGGGIYHDSSESGSLSLYNTIVYANTQSNASSPAGSRDIYGTAMGDANLSSKTISGSGNIAYSSSSAALFTKPSAGDYTLAENSAAIDAGINANAIMPGGSPIQNDLAGNPRIVNNVVDIGAYEYQAKPSFSITMTGYTGTYDGAAHGVTLSGVLATDTVYYSTDGVTYSSTIPPTYTNVGSNLVYAKVSRSGYSDWKGSAAVTITLRPITVTGTTVSDKEYDGSTAATVNIGTVSGLVPGDAVTLSASASFPSSAPGTYSVPVYYTVSGSSSSNYSLPASETCTASIVETLTSKVSVNVVVSNTAPASAELATLPASITSADNGSPVYVQVWVKNNDGSSLGITGGYVDLTYTTPQLTYSTYTPGGDFSEATNLVNSSTAGRLSLFGGCPTPESTSVGVSNWALLGYAAFYVASTGTVTVSAESPTLNGSVNPALNLTRLTHGTLSSSEIDYSSVTFTATSSLPALSAPAVSGISSYGANRHQVVWGAVSNAAGYELQWSTDQSNWNTASTSSSSYVVTGLTYGSLVYYRVRALGDGVTYGNSAWSGVSSLRVCPMDIDGDGFIGTGDYSLLSSSWLRSAGNSSWDPRCDIDGDGLVGPADWSFLMSNWLKYSTSSPLFYPPARGILPEPAAELADLCFSTEEVFADLF